MTITKPRKSKSIYLKLLIFFAFVGLPIGSAVGSHLAAPRVSDYDGMTLIAIPEQFGETFDVPVIKSDDALSRIRQALSMLKDRSPSSTGHINRLKAGGRVIIVYDPHYPNTQASPATLRVAMFLPKYLPIGKVAGADNPAQKEFLVVIGRHGIKWPTADLAAVLVHELVGHGMQHLTDDRLDMRQMDMECEAWLYQEKAHQEFGLDKLSTEMIRFQQQLAFHCDDFIDYLSRSDPGGRQQWQRLNPDVPALLAKFKGYLAEIRSTGVVAKARAYDKARREKQHGRIFREGPASEIKRIGDLYVYGLGVSQNYGLAAKWYRRASDLGCVEAQIGLAILYLDGIGVEQSMEDAYVWLSLVAQNGSGDQVEKSSTLLKVALKNMTARQVATANKRVSAITANSQPCE